MEERLIKDLCDLVSVSSESGEEKDFIEFLKRKVSEELGGVCSLDNYGNLICKIPGKNSTSSEPLMLAAHADTVKPGKNVRPVVKDGVVYSSGDTVLGADCKAGIAEILEAVRTAPQHPPLEIVITREEEVGFVGAKNLDYSMISAKRGVLVDMDALDTIVVGGPSHMLIDIEITGKAAHAGMEPEKGISAIRAASLGISVFKDGRIDHETTANFGIIQGGVIRNGVPEKCSIKAEVRSLNHEKCVALSNTLKEVFEVVARSVGAKAKVELNLAYKATRIPESAPMVQVAREAIQSVGVEPKIMVITGGLESAVYNEKGIETIPIGNGVKAEHSTSENVAVEDMKKVVQVLQHIMKRFS
ncbi:MAG: M20/M25/M40 family metallo-hydrolase [Caldiserica bacterium]|jgi:tripeptide aminopeptidase|nr:M20/M25/M40 family metallo-hydrolase [Caldisericota bacterium]